MKEEEEKEEEEKKNKAKQQCIVGERAGGPFDGECVQSVCCRVSVGENFRQRIWLSFSCRQLCVVKWLSKTSSECCVCSELVKKNTNSLRGP